MSSSDEDRLVQMIWDFMESEAPAPAPSSASSSSSSSLAFSLHQHTCLMLEGILGGVTDAEMEVFERALKYVGEVGSEKNSSSVKKRLMMRLRMDGYDASLCRSSWVSTLECPGGDYEYIDIVMEEKENGGSTRLIVDIDFRSQFELARPTSTYTQLSNSLPPIFVGKEEKLKKTVSLICSAAQESLRKKGLHIPPWRKTIYMQSKWFSCYHKEPTISLPNISMIELKKKKKGAPNSSKVPGESALSRQLSDSSICC